MAVIVVFQAANLTKAQYEESVRQLTGGKRAMTSPADWPVKGLLSHAAGQGSNGFRVVDVWESEEALRQFTEKLEPVLKAVGIDAQPEVYPAHTFVSK